MSWEIALVVSLVGVAFAMFYVANSLDQQHYGIKLLLFLVGLFLLVSNLAVTPQILSANNDTINETIITNLTPALDNSYLAILWVTIFIVFYFIIYFLYTLVRSMKIKKQ